MNETNQLSQTTAPADPNPNHPITNQTNEQTPPNHTGYLPDLQRASFEGNPLRTLRRSLFSAPISELKAFLRTRGDPPAWLLALEDGKGACVPVGVSCEEKRRD